MATNAMNTPFPRNGGHVLSVRAAQSFQPAALDSARQGDQDAFRRLSEPYRRELQLHCYRMLGSFQDAEDLVQETYLRAWRGLAAFEGRTSFRGWLYRIATNACLSAIAKRAGLRRVLPETQSAPAVEEMPGPAPVTEIPWLEPYPDSALEGISDTALGPDARYDLQESVQLAFIAAIQFLPPRQRAVLLLRDVLGWSAAETAGLLDMSVVSANSALQRARATLTKRFPDGEPTWLPTPEEEQRQLLERYVQAWEGADVKGLIRLLRDDAIFSMPPWPLWYRGSASITAFLQWLWRPMVAHQPCSMNAYRLIPTSANGQPAFVVYRRGPQESEWLPHGLQVLTIRDGAVAAMTTFREDRWVTEFGFPEKLFDEAEPGDEGHSKASAASPKG